MAETYYDNSDPGQRFQPGTTAEGEAVDEKFDQVATGLAAAEEDTRRALKFPFEPGMASQEFDATALERRNKVMGFDTNGDLVLTAGFTYRDDWATTTEYFVNDVFRDAGSKNLYVVVLRHTSGVLADDIAAGKVELAIDVAEVEAAKAAAQSAQGLAEDARDASQAAQGASESARDDSQAARDDSRSARDASQDARDSAQAAEANASDTWNAIRERYYGTLASDPSTDPLGGPVSKGDRYFNSTNNVEKVYNGSQWVVNEVSGHVAAADPHPQYLRKSQNLAGLADPAAARDNLSVPSLASFSAVTATAFVKADGSQAAWTAPTATTLETASALALVVGSTIVEIAAGTQVTLPALSAGADYTIYASDAGALQAVDADSAAPAGERVVGGFHASAGAGEIVTRSLWDLNWRPKSNPRGMTLDPGGTVWGDIYLTDVEYTLYGYSRNGQTIADDGNRPILPATVGGDGATVCPSASWWQFLDIFMAAGKRYAIYEELVSLAYGVVERQAVGTDPGTTQHQAGHRSACGCEQITGVMWQWFSGASATGGSGWSNIAEGRGDVYASNLKAPLFGANWGYGSHAGSRASRWNSAPDSSVSYYGARAVSDHLNLQAER